ncbi:ATP-binding protein [Dongia mobilis]|uniref:ATP-binding protein n=1 Tax=Dongia sp. TaxID=1977262 RepID=UPI0026EB8913
MSALPLNIAAVTPPAAAPANRLGRVIAVSGAKVVGLLERDAKADLAQPQRGPHIGELIKIVTDESTVFGFVTGISVEHPLQRDRELRRVELELVGEIDHRAGDNAPFQRGVSNFPALDDVMARASSEDLRRVFTRPVDSSQRSARIGALHQDHSIPAEIMPTELLGKHFAVLGTTGAGKSCAIVRILRALLSQHANAHIVILDPHNEYAAAFKDQAEIVTPADLELPYWLLNFEELREMVIGTGSPQPDADAVLLNQVVTQAKRNMVKDAEAAMQITIDTPVPYRLSDIAKIIDGILGKLDRPADMAAYHLIRERFAHMQADRRLAFMFPGGGGNSALQGLVTRDNMAKILGRLFRVPVGGKPVTVLDTSGVPAEILNVVVSLLCRMSFDFALWSEQKAPVLLVCEEAHRYAPADTKAGFEPTKRALSRIAKEGRKYGVSLCLISRRQSELDTTVLSQCSTIFALRMTSQKDQEFLAAALPESSLGLMSELPSLRNGQAIAVGEGVPLPTRIDFDRLAEAHQPHSRTAPFASAWQQDQLGAADLGDIVKRWRHQV